MKLLFAIAASAVAFDSNFKVDANNAVGELQSLIEQAQGVADAAARDEELSAKTEKVIEDLHAAQQDLVEPEKPQQHLHDKASKHNRAAHHPAGAKMTKVVDHHAHAALREPTPAEKRAAEHKEKMKKERAAKMHEFVKAKSQTNGQKKASSLVEVPKVTDHHAHAALREPTPAEKRAAAKHKAKMMKERAAKMHGVVKAHMEGKKKTSSLAQVPEDHHERTAVEERRAAEHKEEMMKERAAKMHTVVKASTHRAKAPTEGKKKTSLAQVPEVTNHHEPTAAEERRAAEHKEKMMKARAAKMRGAVKAKAHTEGKKKTSSLVEVPKVTDHHAHAALREPTPAEKRAAAEHKEKMMKARAAKMRGAVKAKTHREGKQTHQHTAVHKAGQHREAGVPKK